MKKHICQRCNQKLVRSSKQKAKEDMYYNHRLITFKGYVCNTEYCEEGM